MGFLEPLKFDEQNQAKIGALLLAFTLHFGVWQFYRNIPEVTPPEITTPTIEVDLVVAPKAAPASAPASAAPASAVATPQPPAPKPKAQPEPVKPKPVPKMDKPVPPKVEKPKPKPIPKPRPEPEEEPTPRPEPVRERVREPEPEAPAPAPVHHADPAPREVEAAPAAPAHEGAGGTGHHKAPTKESDGEEGENHAFSKGTVKGYRITYPAAARERGWEGAVTASIKVSADGEIEDVSLVNGSGHDMLDEHALDIIRSASHVKPCYRGDKPVACKFTQTIVFRLNKE